MSWFLNADLYLYFLKLVSSSLLSWSLSLNITSCIKSRYCWFWDVASSLSDFLPTCEALLFYFMNCLAIAISLDKRVSNSSSLSSRGGRGASSKLLCWLSNSAFGSLKLEGAAVERYKVMLSLGNNRSLTSFSLYAIPSFLALSSNS